MREEKKEADDRSAAPVSESADDLQQPTSVPSIKDRISVFAGTVKSTPPAAQQRRNTFGGPNSGPGGKYMKSAAPPPKLDIYSRTTEEPAPSQYHPDDVDTYEHHGSSGVDVAGEEFQHGRPPEASDVPPSPAATAAAETATKYLKPSQMVQSKKAAASRHSTGSTRSSIVNSYLNGLQSSTTANTTASSRSCFQQQPAPLADVNGNNPYVTEEMNGSVVGHSLSEDRSDGGKSSISYADAGNASGRKNNVWRRPGQFAPNVPANHGGNNNGTTNTPSPASNNSINGHNGNSNKDNQSNNGPSVEMIERMVDERVQIQLREVEARMEGLLRRWMDQMNTKITYRLDAMEASIKDSMPSAYPRSEIWGFGFGRTWLSRCRYNTSTSFHF
jgi:hypothetical protein